MRVLPTMVDSGSKRPVPLKNRPAPLKTDQYMYNSYIIILLMHGLNSLTHISLRMLTLVHDVRPPLRNSWAEP